MGPQKLPSKSRSKSADTKFLCMKLITSQLWIVHNAAKAYTTRMTLHWHHVGVPLSSTNTQHTTHTAQCTRCQRLCTHLFHIRTGQSHTGDLLLAEVVDDALRQYNTFLLEGKAIGHLQHHIQDCMRTKGGSFCLPCAARVLPALASKSAVAHNKTSRRTCQHATTSAHDQPPGPEQWQLQQTLLCQFF